MRRVFADLLLNEARKDDRIILVTADLGYKVWDQFRTELPDQFLNTGAAEQTACGIAVGLALSGKIPFLYSITPFLLCRCYETIRNYVNEEKIPVKLIGSGRDDDYKHDGFSHFAGDDKQIMRCFPHIKAVWPQTEYEIPVFLQYMIKNKDPYYMNLAR